MERVYSDLEPFTKSFEEERHIVELHVPGFKREDLRVQTICGSILKITGERQLEGNKWSRFCKEINFSDDCDTNRIRSTFTNGLLTIIMPKKPQERKTRAQEQEETKQENGKGKPAEDLRAPEAEKKKTGNDEDLTKPEARKKTGKDEDVPEPEVEKKPGKVAASDISQIRELHMDQMYTLAKMEMHAKCVKFAVRALAILIAVAVVAYGAEKYVTHLCKSNPDQNM